MAACLLILEHTHTHTHSKVSEMPSEPPDEKTPPHNQALLMQGEALFFGWTMSVLTFLCLLVLSTKSSRKNGKTKEKKVKRGMQSQPLTSSDLYKPFLFISPISNSFLFNNHAREFERPTALFDEDMFEWRASLLPTCHLSHTRGISLSSGGDDDDSVAGGVIEK